MRTRSLFERPSAESRQDLQPLRLELRSRVYGALPNGEGRRVDLVFYPTGITPRPLPRPARMPNPRQVSVKHSILDPAMCLDQGSDREMDLLSWARPVSTPSSPAGEAILGSVPGIGTGYGCGSCGCACMSACTRSQLRELKPRRDGAYAPAGSIRERESRDETFVFLCGIVLYYLIEMLVACDWHGRR